MIVNNGGNLSKEYFTAYLLLIMNSKQYNLEEAKELTFKRLFKNDKKALGSISFKHLNNAYEELKKESNKNT